MNKFYEEAKEKLKKESAAGKFDKYGNAMKAAVVKALEEFCLQSEVFAEAVAHGKSFEECMKDVAKGVSGGSISDLEAYKRAVRYYMKGADVRFCMEINVGTEEKKAEEQNAEQSVERKAPEIIDLSAFI